MKKIILFYLLLYLVLPSMQATNYLFKNKKTSYVIVVPSEASTSEHTAATELQTYLKQICKAEFPIASFIVPSKKFIFIGWNKACNCTRPSSEDEAYTYKTIDGNLYIWGGSERGTMYGVFSFLENELGVKWYTSDYTKIPKLSTFELKDLNHTEEPCIKHRLDFYYIPLTDAVWCAHNKQNEQYSPKSNNYGNTTACYGTHTMFHMVPPESYFKSHPEYFSKIKGKRKYENGQLCLSNKNVLTIAKKAIIKAIAEHPGYWVYDISQMDNQNYCQCKNCTKIAKQYGGQSGLMIWFVNQVADAVMDVYPDKMVSTLAYQYTRHTPTGIKPRDNVVIKLCDIECCFSHPLSDASCEKNVAFMNDLKSWGQISKNIFVWDYVVNFFGYLIPYPNFNVLSSNIKTFADNGTVGILEEGAHECKWGEFSELRTWILSKLLWNPYVNTEKLIKEFCNDYYGKGANEIYKYYQLSQGTIGNYHLQYNTQYGKDIFGDDFTTQSLTLLQSAYNKIKGNKDFERRVNRIIAQVYNIYICNHPHASISKVYYQKLKEILKSDPTNVREGSADLDKMIKEQSHN